MAKLTRGYVDTVVRMRTDKNDARKFLRRQLYELRNHVTREHYFEMYDYINAVTK